MPRYRHLSVAIPMLAESANLPSLLQQLCNQTCQDFTLYVCVNNEEGGYGYDDNQTTLHLLRSYSQFPIVIIDRSSTGQGWTGKRKGVGWARKILFDRILSDHDENEIVVSLDADTDFDNNYFDTLLHTLNLHNQSNALCVPYYHPLSGDPLLDRPLLRYECYMRHYLIQLLRIGNPYAFTALGSAMVFPLWAYKKVGGITPLQGGEDFYLMQKFAKTGRIELLLSTPANSSPVTVRPQGRPSLRVPFGTGPAIASGMAEMDNRYPFYSPQAFDAVKATYDTFPDLYLHDLPTPMSPFLCQQLDTNDLWSPLRRNFRTPQHFIHACAERVDGLRILQFLKNNPSFRLTPDALPVNFLSDPIPQLDNYRNLLFAEEMNLRKKNSFLSIQ
ncbi:MAG: hypothetical protein IKN11_01700 [Bacteroidales bacterium]|nr:hypothetical protein [Bacteroidales bacterium]